MHRIDQTLEDYSPIDLAGVDGVQLMNRVDTKYLLSVRALSEVLDRLSPHYRVLTLHGERSSHYSTLYYDTPALTSYRQHHSGKANRRKFRMRTYASSGQTFFEVKTKTSRGRTVKKRIPIREIGETLGPESIDLVQSLAGGPVNLSPSLWTSFRRTTLTGKVVAERVTIDTDLSFRAGAKERELSGAAIIEVKQGRDDRNSPIRRRLRELSVRPMRVSKYCIGCALLDPSLKQNRFKAKIRAIRSLSSC